MRLKFILVAFVLFGVAGACNKHTDETQVVIYTRAPLKSIISISQVGLAGGNTRLVDTATIHDNHDSLVFFISRSGQNLYSIALNANRRLVINFINDSKLVRIRADYFTDTCKIEGSPASMSLKQIDDNQAKMAKRLEYLSKQIDSIKSRKMKGNRIDSLLKLYNLITVKYFDNYRAYADTVKNPIAFIRVFTSIQFGKDYAGLHAFTDRNSKRFHEVKAIQNISKQVYRLLRIYEHELNLGEPIPAITLPDQSGLPWSTTSLKGQYYLVDLWATWCQDCSKFKAAQEKLAALGADKNFKTVSIALDGNINGWRTAIDRFKYPAVQLIDTASFPGPTVNKLLFDSIPFNFLVNPQGKIIAKAIKPDSLAFVIKKLVKK